MYFKPVNVDDIKNSHWETAARGSADLADAAEDTSRTRKEGDTKVTQLHILKDAGLQTGDRLVALPVKAGFRADWM